MLARQQTCSLAAAGFAGTATAALTGSGALTGSLTGSGACCCAFSGMNLCTVPAPKEVQASVKENSGERQRRAPTVHPAYHVKHSASQISKALMIMLKLWKDTRDC